MYGILPTNILTSLTVNSVSGILQDSSQRFIHFLMQFFFVAFLTVKMEANPNQQKVSKKTSLYPGAPD